MAAEMSTSTSSPDSYIGSFISLTSKSDIRYEGILYAINTGESSIGLRNVRSFGTEGRRKDGQQIPSSDKIYEFIIFRGSDIKDLMVKTSSPSQTALMQNDPAIIQPNYLHPSTASPNLSASLPSFGSISAPVFNYSTAHLGLQTPILGGLPTYQTGTSSRPWSSNVSGISAPMHWQGLRTNSQEVSHLQQPSLIRPSPELSIPLQQTLQFSGTNTHLSSGSSKFPELSSLFPFVNNNLKLLAPSLSLAVPPIPIASLAPQIAPFSVSNEILKPSLSAPIMGAMLPPTFSVAPSIQTSALQQNVLSAVKNNPREDYFFPVANQTDTRHTLPISRSSISKHEKPLVTLMTEDEHNILFKDEEDNPPKDKTKLLLFERPPARFQGNTTLTCVPKEPILPLPSHAYQKSNESILHATQSSRGLGRGSGSRYARPADRCTQEFDFTAMNKKFNKDEVWGNLGKCKARFGRREEGGNETHNLYKGNARALKLDSKDDFFDVFSCDTNMKPSGRAKLLDQLKIDTETFGNFQSHHSTYAGRGFRGGSRGRSPYRGRSHVHLPRGRGYNAYN